MAVRDEKFESFLKRTLDAKTYEDVKTYDPCVVLSKNENYSFRFVLLTSEVIFITDNPPTSILHSIHLSAIKNARAILDKAVFLQKELQDITQHYFIKYVFNGSNLQISDPLSSLTVTSSESLGGIDRPDAASNSSSMVKSFKNLFTRKPTLLQKSVSTSVLSETDRTALNSYQHMNSSYRDSDYSEPTSSLVSVKTGLFENGDSETDSSYSSSLHQNPSSVQQVRWTQHDVQKCDVLDPFTLSDDTIPALREMHIYVLNQNTLFFPFLKSAWRVHLLKSTAKLGALIPALEKPADPNTLRVLFSELKEDILHCLHEASSAEVVYRYIHELKSAAMEHNVLQSLFWQDIDLFSACKSFLSRFIDQGSPYQDERMDEIDCSVLIVETLTLMLQHAEVISTCQVLLQKQSTTFYASLLAVLLSSSLENVFASKRNEELLDLAREYSRAVTDVLYQLIVIADQAHWNCSSVTHPTLTVQTLFSIIDSSRGLTWLLDEIVRDAVTAWTGSDRPSSTSLVKSPASVASGLTVTSSSIASSTHEAVAPADCVRIYRQFVVLHRCISKCWQAKNHATSSYREEFKYYIRPDLIDRKIPEAYPACAVTRNVVQAVACLVLGLTK